MLVFRVILSIIKQYDRVYQHAEMIQEKQHYHHSLKVIFRKISVTEPYADTLNWKFADASDEDDGCESVELLAGGGVLADEQAEEEGEGLDEVGWGFFVYEEGDGLVVHGGFRWLLVTGG